MQIRGSRDALEESERGSGTQRFVDQKCPKSICPGTQRFVDQKCRKSICPVVNFIYSHHEMWFQGSGSTFFPDTKLLDDLLSTVPQCPRKTPSQPLPDITQKWLQKKLAGGPATKATGDDGLKYYILRMAREGEPPPPPLLLRLSAVLMQREERSLGLVALFFLFFPTTSLRGFCNFHGELRDDDKGAS